MRDAIKPMTPKMAKIGMNPSNNWVSQKSIFIEKSRTPIKQTSIYGDKVTVSSRNDIMDEV